MSTLNKGARSSGWDIAEKNNIFVTKDAFTNPK